MAKILVVSNGPVPSMKYVKIEGGGQRSWGLATGLAAHGHDVTVAVPSTYPLSAQSKTTEEDISLINWSTAGDLSTLASDLGTIIISYSMGKKATAVLDKLNSSVRVILDCYVPIYIEVSARRAKNLENSYANYLVDLKYYNKALHRGDYFLCANIPQKHYYEGVLSALGIINPSTYGQFRVLLVPSGVENSKPAAKNNPYTNLGIKSSSFVLLWFGGLYPWFNIVPLLQAIKELSANNNLNLVIVGGKNPYNKEKTITKQYDTAVSYAKENNLLDTSIHFVDWVDYESRGSWYAHAGAVISLNDLGEESVYSWRTRIMDYVWGEAAILTNGGDPLSEELLAREAAVRLDFADNILLASKLADIIDNRPILNKVRKNIKVIKQDYYWESVVEPVHEKLQDDTHPFRVQESFDNKVRLKYLRAKFYSTRIGEVTATLPRKLKRLLK